MDAIGTRFRPPDGVRPTAAVWTGVEMLMWGVRVADGTSAGGRYDPLRDNWRAMTSAGAPSARLGAVVVWTGSQLLIWGGEVFDGNQWLADGELYDPATDTWVEMTSVGAPGPFSPAAYAWTDTPLVVWGGSSENVGGTAQGAQYDPSADTWMPMATAKAPSPSAVSALWDGCEILACCALTFPGNQVDGGRYDPLADTWARLPVVGAPTARWWPSVVWDSREMIVWGGRLGGAGLGAYNTGGRYTPPREHTGNVAKRGPGPPL